MPTSTLSYTAPPSIPSITATPAVNPYGNTAPSNQQTQPKSPTGSTGGRTKNPNAPATKPPTAQKNKTADGSQTGYKSPQEEGDDRIDSGHAAALGQMNAAAGILLDLPAEIQEAFGPALTWASGQVDSLNAAFESAVQRGDQAAADAAQRGLTAIREAEGRFREIGDAWSQGLSDVRNQWNETKANFSDTSAQSAARSVSGLWANADQSISELRSTASQLGIPADQVNAQVRQMKMMAGFEAGRIVAESQATVNGKLAEIDTNFAGLYSSVYNTGLNVIQAAGADVSNVTIQQNLQTLNAELNASNVALQAAEGLKGVADWYSGVQLAVGNATAQGIILSAQGMASIAEIKSRIEQWGVEQWENWQLSWENVYLQADSLTQASTPA